MKGISRRAALLASGGLLLAGPAAAQDKVKVKFGVLTTASQAAFYVGARKGIFAKYGFDVEVLPLATGVQANQALAAGQADWSGGGVESTVVAWATGLPFKAYSMYAKGGDSYGILVRKESGIASPKDLKGKKIAVPQGTAPAQGLNQVLKEAGLPRDSVQRVNANYGNMGQMLVSGAVDAMAGLEPFLTLTEEKMEGKASILLRLGKHVQGGGLFLISDKWAAANPTKVADAVAALWESQQWVRQNQKEAAALEAEFLKVEPRIVEVSFKVLTYDPVIDDFTAKSLQTTADYLAEEKLIPAPIKLEPHLAALNKVTAELKAKKPELLK
ncbi:MAG: ABC transporter substrate-binding protein [Reyranella sp.]|uniref:ABC transporter substrate-binding protein n=1 Tax=Reyranella sp. TaxID=1929291 RepID=UPI001AD406B1|nr:ABC transporter substrate-binding protein [Reyranella sp.]MBN9086387.1 ABC transporter substrate-binding protein [Reyranella sp.]